jgi:hypothetical protein
MVRFGSIDFGRRSGGGGPHELVEHHDRAVPHHPGHFGQGCARLVRHEERHAVEQRADLVGKDTFLSEAKDALSALLALGVANLREALRFVPHDDGGEFHGAHEVYFGLSERSVFRSDRRVFVSELTTQFAHVGVFLGTAQTQSFLEWLLPICGEDGERSSLRSALVSMHSPKERKISV